MGVVMSVVLGLRLMLEQCAAECTWEVLSQGGGIANCEGVLDAGG